MTQHLPSWEDQVHIHNISHPFITAKCSFQPNEPLLHMASHPGTQVDLGGKSTEFLLFAKYKQEWSHCRAPGVSPSFLQGWLLSAPYWAYPAGQGLAHPPTPTPAKSHLSLFSTSKFILQQTWTVRAPCGHSCLLALELAVLSWNVLHISHPPPLPCVKTAICRCLFPSLGEGPLVLTEPLCIPLSLRWSPVNLCLLVPPQDRGWIASCLQTHSQAHYQKTLNTLLKNKHMNKWTNRWIPISTTVIQVSLEAY